MSPTFYLPSAFPILLQLFSFSSFQFSSVQLLSRVWLFATPWITACQVSLSITNSRSSLRLTSIESVMPSSHLSFCCPLLLLPLIPPSIRVFSKESTLWMTFPVVMYKFESWTIQKTDHWRIDVFELQCWRRLLRVPGTTRRSNQLILKEINIEYSLEGLMLKLKLQYFGHVMQRTNSLEKTRMLRKFEYGKRRGVTEDEMVGWHHRHNGHEFEQTVGNSDR